MDEDIQITGSYETDTGGTLMVVFERCDQSDPEAKCRSESEIDDWLMYRWIVVLENRREFQQREFDDKSVVKSSFFRWFSLTPQIRMDYVREIQR